MKVGWLSSLISQDGSIKIYVCGPTVYDDIHIGNIRTVIVFDILIRYLKECKKEYIYVHNITDIDDKIIKKSIDEDCLESDVSEKYTKKYISILRCLNIVMPCHLPKVTEEITFILDVLRDMEHKKHAYFKDKNLYFDISKFTDKYCEISHQKLDQLSSNSKEDINFVLWKSTDVGRTWDSPWGPGRPGWHVECLCFIKKFFNRPICIHGGGIDLKFPHHENENILSHSCFGQSIATHWIHVGKVTYKGKKISKSSGSRIFLVKDLMQKYGPNVLRYFFFRTGFSKPIVVDDNTLDECQHEINLLLGFIHQAKTQVFYCNNTTNIEDFKNTTKPTELKKLWDLINNDLDLPNILSFVREMKSEISIELKNLLIATTPDQNTTKQHDCIQKPITNLITKINKMLFALEWLGFTVENLHNYKNVQKIKNMKIFKDKKQYKEADQIRSELQDLGLLNK